MSPDLASLKATLFSQCGPLMALQVRYLALKPHPITCSSRGTQRALRAKAEGIEQSTSLDLLKRTQKPSV